MMNLDGVLRKAVEMGASDVLFKVRLPPVTRVRGILAPIKGEERLSTDELERVARSIMREDQWNSFLTTREFDGAYGIPSVARFRVNIFFQRDSIAMVLRVVPAEPPLIKELELPDIVQDLAMEMRGLVLVTGTTGSGKSTTLAAMTNHINSYRNCHLITIEDPIEYYHRDRKSIINQREVGRDTLSFSNAIRSALRENPDVILVGEMRDLETISTAMLAAETGHLVLSTLHTLDAVETIWRIVSVFPAQHQTSTRFQLAKILRGVISQRLLIKADGNGRVPAVEILIATSRIRECIVNENRSFEIRDAISEGHVNYGMQTFDQSIMQLYKKQLITYETALASASNPEDFALFIQGVSGHSEAKWEMNA
jgi:twitching motility protein PilT